MLRENYLSDQLKKTQNFKELFMKRVFILLFLFIFILSSCDDGGFISVQTLPNEIEHLSVIVDYFNSNELNRSQTYELETKISIILSNYLRTLPKNPESLDKASSLLVTYELHPEAIIKVEEFIEMLNEDIRNSQISEAAYLRTIINNGLTSEVSRVIYENHVSNALDQNKINEIQAYELRAFINTKLAQVAQSERRARAWGLGE